MKKWKGIAMAVILVVALTIPLVASSNAFATLQGLTPGYWKNHTGAWPAGVTPCDRLFDVVNTVTGLSTVPGDFPDDLSMGEALTAKGNSNEWNAFYRHLAAALLNQLHPNMFYLDQASFTFRVQAAIAGDPEYAKNQFDGFNQTGNIDLGPGSQGKVKDWPLCP